MAHELRNCLMLLLAASCGTSTADVALDEMHDGVALEGAGDGDVASAQQGIVSGTPYYRWSSRTDATAPQYEGCSPALNQLLAYLRARWGGSSLGCHNNRRVAGSSTWSTHAWGAALDYTSGSWDTNFGPIADFLIAHSEELGINTIHDYRHVGGRGRMWKPGIGWARSNVGGPGDWMHIEVRPDEYSDGRPVDEKLGAVGADGCTSSQRSAAAAFGCACVNGSPNGGWCPGTGCTSQQTNACGQFGAGCADGRCSGIFAPGWACTPLEFKNCGTYLSGCINHQCRGGRVDGTNPQNCTEQRIYDCSRYGCGCKDGECSDGSCPVR